MAEVLKDYSFRLGCHPSYPWDEWLDGRAWRLKRGEDFHVSIDGFRNAARGAASRKGRTLKTSMEDENTIVIAAHTKD